MINFLHGVTSTICVVGFLTYFWRASWIDVLPSFYFCEEKFSSLPICYSWRSYRIWSASGAHGPDVRQLRSSEVALRESFARGVSQRGVSRNICVAQWLSSYEAFNCDLNACMFSSIQNRVHVRLRGVHTTHRNSMTNALEGGRFCVPKIKHFFIICMKISNFQII